MTTATITFADHMPQPVPAMVDTALKLELAEGETEVNSMHLSSLERKFNHFGPFHYCKANGLLVDNSGEEFAIQFMTYVNSMYPGTY